MATPDIIGMVLIICGIVFGGLGTSLAFHVDKENKKPHLAPLRYIGAAFLMGMAINAFVFAYAFFIYLP